MTERRYFPRLRDLKSMVFWITYIGTGMHASKQAAINHHDATLSLYYSSIQDWISLVWIRQFSPMLVHIQQRVDAALITWRLGMGPIITKPISCLHLFTGNQMNTCTEIMCQCTDSPDAYCALFNKPLWFDMPWRNGSNPIDCTGFWFPNCFEGNAGGGEGVVKTKCVFLTLSKPLPRTPAAHCTSCRTRIPGRFAFQGVIANPGLFVILVLEFKACKLMAF